MSLPSRYYIIISLFIAIHSHIFVLGNVWQPGIESYEYWLKKIEVLGKDYNKHSLSIPDQSYVLLFHFLVIFKLIF